jgi:RNA polymerase sigma-70 factor (ECF subfamily)
LSGQVAAGSADNDAVVGQLLKLGREAYGLAARILDTRDGADDVVQQAYLKALREVRAGWSPGDARTWFLRVVANTARDWRRRETARRRREAKAVSSGQSVSFSNAELSAVLDHAMRALVEDQRLALALCYEQGLSQKEAAAVLEVPESTLSDRLRAGLAKLKKSLAEAGFAATSATVISGLAGTAPPVPAALAAAVGKILSGEAAGVSSGAGSAGAAVGVAAKGGIAMKILVSVVAAGVLAGAAGLSAFGFRPSEPRDVAGGPPTVAAGPSDGTPAPVNPFNGMQEREEVFEFAEKPKVTKAGDKWVITFASKGKCDATVSILDKNGVIIRHLASGVLGVNAPWPFQQNSLSQKIEWDGLTTDFKKADAAGCKVRVGLGLQAQFDKSIAYDPYLLPPETSPVSYLVPLHGQMLVGTDSDGKFYIGTMSRCNVTGQVFGKDGKYIRTFFPPPAADVEKVMGGRGYKFGTTKWGDKVMISSGGLDFGPFASLLPRGPSEPPAGARSFKDLLEAYPSMASLIKSQPGVGEVKSVPRPKEIPAPTVPGSVAVVGHKYLRISADRARDEVYALGGGLRFIGKTGELDKTWGMGGWESSVGPDGLFYFRWNSYMTRMDHDGKHAPFSKENTVHVPGGSGWWDRVPPAFKATGVDALDAGNLCLSMTHQCGLHIAPNGLVVAGIQYPNFEWGKKMGVQWDTKDRAASFVVVFDRDGKLVTGNAVGQTGNGTAVTMDRDGNVYAILNATLPAGQKTYDGCDVGVGANGGCSGWVKFRGLGGKYPLNVGPGTKVGKGEELPGAVWVYPGMPAAMAGCFCHHSRPDMDFWARSWIPSNQLYSVTVLDSNMNRIARFGRYGNVDDADPKVGKIHFAWLRAVAASDVALYAADHGNRRILRAALSYAAEETVPAP